ncbi:MAG: LPS assembly protein LptD [Desulfobulbales bacterium]|nr:LPS assembly protein LptD [Desulfobulbales bacterium]
MQSLQPPYRPFCRAGGAFLLLFLAVSACFVERGNALENPTEPWTLEADRITYRESPEEVNAEGNVVMRRREKDSAIPLLLKADSVSYLVEKAQIDAAGDVIIKEKSGTIAAADARLNLRERTGRLSATTITLADQEMMFSGKLAEKTGEARYIFHDGRVTSCRTTGDEAPDWSINWKKADITIDGLARLKHATFKVKKVPLLYIPYLVLPAKVTRQTGFLFPELSHSSRDGTALLAPFFLNLSPSSDLTFYPGYYEKRGVFGGLEFRHVFNDDSAITLAANYQRDRTEDQGPPGSDDDYRRDGYPRTEHDRYWLRGKADHYFSPGLALHLDIDTVSDQDYLHEYRDGITGFSENNRDFLGAFNRGLQEATLNFRESILQLTGHGELSNGGIEVRYADNVLSDYTGAEEAQTLPRILFGSRQPLADLPLSFSWNSEYVHYRPEEGIGYQRLDLQPGLVMPIPLGPLIEGSIIGGFRETAYRIENVNLPAAGNSAFTRNRNSLDFTTNIATVLSRDFSINNEQRLTHAFRPNLRYSYQENGDQSDLPGLDNVDRLKDDNRLTVELNNYFRTGKSGPPSLPDRQIGHLKLSQSYDLAEARRDPAAPDDKRRPFSDLALDLEISPLNRLFFRYQTALTVYGNGISRYKLESRYSNSRQDSLVIDYDYVKGAARNLNLSSRLRLTADLSAAYSTTRSLLLDHTTGETVSLIFTSQCWEMELASIKDSEDRRVMLTFSLTGIGKAFEARKSGV